MEEGNDGVHWRLVVPDTPARSDCRSRLPDSLPAAPAPPLALAAAAAVVVVAVGSSCSNSSSTSRRAGVSCMCGGG